MRQKASNHWLKEFIFKTVKELETTQRNARDAEDQRNQIFTEELQAIRA